MKQSVIDKIRLGVWTVVFALCNPAIVFADGADVSFLEGEGNGAFDSLTETAKSTMASMYQFAFICSTGCLAIALLFGFFKLGFFKGQEREKQKGAIGWIVVAIIGVTSAISIFTLIAGLSAGMFSNASVTSST